MPALGNLGFEDVGASAGAADLWTRSAIATATEVAEFGTAGLETQVESFESEWLSNEDFLFEFGVADVSPAIYDAALPTPEGAEDFEEGWTNDTFSFSLSALEAAGLDSALVLEETEDFEEGWSSNEAWSDALGSVTAAAFDVGTPEGAEDFEEEWSSNEAWSDTIASTDDAMFNLGADAVEDFEAPYTDEVFLPIPATDNLTLVGHGFAGGEQVTFWNRGGRLPAPLVSGYSYVVILVDANNIRVEPTLAAGAIDITDTGIGTHYLRADPRLYWLVDP